MVERRRRRSERIRPRTGGPRTLPTPTHSDAEQPAITINNSILPCVTAGFLLAVEPRPLLPSRKSRTTVLPPLPLPARRFPFGSRFALSPPAPPSPSPLLSLSLSIFLPVYSCSSLLLWSQREREREYTFRFNRVTFRVEMCACVCTAYDRMHSRYRRCVPFPETTRLR